MPFARFCFQLLLLGALSGLGTPLFAAEKFPLKQGLHEWPALGGKLFLVVGTYQDTVSYRRTYNFFFKEAKAEEWNQVPVLGRKGNQQFTWQSAVGGEVTIADGTIVARQDGTVYFVVADKRIGQSYQDRGTITVTWYKLTQSGDDQPDDLAYQLKPAFVRDYPNAKQTVEDILAKEVVLQPRKQ